MQHSPAVQNEHCERENGHRLGTLFFLLQFQMGCIWSREKDRDLQRRHSKKSKKKTAADAGDGRELGRVDSDARLLRDFAMDRLCITVEDAEVLAREIAWREQSAVRKSVNSYSQAHVKAGMQPLLRDIREPDAANRAKTDGKVAIYEELEAAARRMPSLVDVRRRPLEESSVIYSRVTSFEVIDREGKQQYGPPIQEIQARRDFSNPRQPMHPPPPATLYTL